ncbi:hypothetical protein ACCO45_008841 [Purpureocillium lilacinum]|uniref:Uncharacterized protein n=1 Tax=Purpureocillium lilacinum TaxID=33203 RepID=A0ACC4DHX8_PURLI
MRGHPAIRVACDDKATAATAGCRTERAVVGLRLSGRRCAVRPTISPTADEDFGHGQPPIACGGAGDDPASQLGHVTTKGNHNDVDPGSIRSERGTVPYNARTTIGTFTRPVASLLRRDISTREESRQGPAALGPELHDSHHGLAVAGGGGGGGVA